MLASSISRRNKVDSHFITLKWSPDIVVIAYSDTVDAGYKNILLENSWHIFTLIQCITVPRTTYAIPNDVFINEIYCNISSPGIPSIYPF